jgi:hypothetical protein
MALAKSNPAAADWNEIRSWFARANRLDTENAEPLMLYYQSFLKAGVRPTDNATRGMLYALVLAPQDRSLRFMAVRQLLIDRRLPEARQALAPLAFTPHAIGSRDTAQKVLDLVDAGKSDAAVTMIDDWERELDRR